MSGILEKYTSLTIQHQDISDYAEEITDKQYNEMEECEDKIKQALKLQELVKEEIEKNNQNFKILGSDSCIMQHTQGLQHLIEESEK